MAIISITRVSCVSGQVRTRQFNIDKKKYEAWLEGKMLIQDAMSNLSDDDREFILSGSTREEWEQLGVIGSDHRMGYQEEWELEE